MPPPPLSQAIHPRFANLMAFIHFEKGASYTSSAALGLWVIVLGCLLGGQGVEAEEKIFVDFRQPGAVQGWYVINDGVMGGVSTSQFTHHIDKAVFSGVVSLDNNGGFASLRSAPESFDFSAFQSIALRVRGDGKTYKFTVRTDNLKDGVNYRSAFATKAGEWMTVKLPFTDFRASFRGQSVPDAPPLEPSRVVTLGFLIADRQAGPFQLEIQQISAVK